MRRYVVYNPTTKEYLKSKRYGYIPTGRIQDAHVFRRRSDAVQSLRYGGSSTSWYSEATCTIVAVTLAEY